MGNPISNLEANIEKITSTLGNSKMWIRVAMFFLGCVLVGISIVKMSGTAKYAVKAASIMKGG